MPTYVGLRLQVKTQGGYAVLGDSARAALVLGAYKPSAATTGRLTQGILPAYTGPLTITTAGTEIVGRTIDGVLDVRASGVRVRDCLLRGFSVEPTGTGGDTACVLASSAACVDLVVEDCTFDPQIPSAYQNAVTGHDFTVRRCDIRHTTDYFGVFNTNAPGQALNVNIEGNYCHDLRYQSPDHMTRSDFQTHNDGAQVQGGTGVRIVGNTIVALYSTVVGTQPAPLPNEIGQASGFGPSLSCVLFNQNVGNTGLHTITDNYFSGGYVPINCGGATGANLGSILRNKFARNSGIINGVRQTIKLRSDQVCNTGTGADRNVWEDDLTPVVVQFNG